PSVHSIILFAAGNKGRISYEDTLAAGAFVNHFHNELNCKLTDAAHLAKSIYEMHKGNIKDFIKTTEHAKLLQNLGFEQDIEIASTIDLYPIIPFIEGNSIKILKSTEVKNG
ncbi:MAG TPA: 2-phosphosulfolactate phosphatase, partial [Candidatus Kapabacteria bacterium]|nr:2-phosphosulfolactate phosphatase [Candidatus Kapabacteria bacterium]